MALECLDDGFLPIDGRVFGNEGGDHNYHFTYRTTARFVFEQCAGQFVEFQGGDGFWLFIDDRLAIDLGGVDCQTSQYLEVDRLGLTDGEEYTFSLFYANRLLGQSQFRLRTNLKLTQDSPIGAITAPFD